MTIYFTAQDALTDDIQLNRASVERIIKQHSLSPDDFFAELGVQDSYWACEVFIWLGY